MNNCQSCQGTGFEEWPPSSDSDEEGDLRTDRIIGRRYCSFSRGEEYVFSDDRVKFEELSNATNLASDDNKQKTEFPNTVTPGDTLIVSAAGGSCSRGPQTKTREYLRKEERMKDSASNLANHDNKQKTDASNTDNKK